MKLKEHTRNQKRMYRIHKQNEKIHDLELMTGKLQQENKQLKNNWNELKEYIMNDINSRNGSKVVEIEDCRKVSETIFPTYVLIEDKSKTMREVLNKMQELEGSDKR